jgi:hypothetical protein
MWDILKLIGAIGAAGGLFWALLRLLKNAQAQDQSYSGKDSGRYYNDGISNDGTDAVSMG